MRTLAGIGVQSEDMRGKDMASDFTYRADANGYMIFYKGQPIGGAGVRLPRENPLRGRQGERNRQEFASNAQNSIRALEQGHGEARYLKVMAEIDAKDSVESRGSASQPPA